MQVGQFPQQRASLIRGGYYSPASLNPFDNPGDFYRRGISTGKSTKWQCRKCRKITNVLPERSRNFSYHQKKHDLSPTIAELMLSKIPVTRLCKVLDIAPKTYYCQSKKNSGCEPPPPLSPTPT